MKIRAHPAPAPDAPAASGPATRLAGFCERLVEACWLAAAAGVPVFFCVWGSRPFETAKIALVRTLATVAACALVVRAIEGARAPRAGAAPRRWLPADLDGRGRAVVAAALVWLLARALATAVSIDRSMSLWGSFERGDGLLTSASYVVLFLGVALLLRTRAQLGRLLAAVLGSTAAVVLWAVLMRFDLDPFPASLGERTASTLGNPIALGGLVAVVAPLAAALLVAALRQSPRPRGRALALAALLALMVHALWASKSRGPALGLAAGCAVLVLVDALVRGRFRVARVLAVLGVTAVLAGAAVVWARIPPLEAFRAQGPRPDRSAAAAAADTGRERGGGKAHVNRAERRRQQHARKNRLVSAVARLAVWTGAAPLVTESPLRALLGHGPDTLRLALSPHLPPELNKLGDRHELPDRAHNETLDTALDTGLFGCAAWLSFMAALALLGVARAGVPGARARPAATAALLAASVLAAVAVARVATGTFLLSGLAAPAGLLVGLGLALLRQVRGAAAAGDAAAGEPPPAPTPAAPDDRALALGLLAGVVAHFVEVQVAFGVAGTRVVLWLAAGALVALPALRAEESVAARASQRRDGRGASPAGRRDLVAAGLVAGSALALVGWNLASPFAAGRLVPSLLGGLGAWALGASFSVTSSGRGGGSDRDGRAGFVPHAAGAVAALALLVSVRAALPALADHPDLAPVWPWAFVLLATLAIALVLPAPRPGARPAFAGMTVLLYPVLALAALRLSAHVDLDLLRADAAFQAGHDRAAASNDRGADLDGIRRAIEWQPREGHYRIALAQTLAERAQTAPSAEAYADAMAEVETAFAEARAVTPLDPDAPTLLANALKIATQVTREPAARRRWAAKAGAAFERATQIRPTDPALWNQWCQLALVLDDPVAAEPRCRRSLEIDGSFLSNYTYLGQIHAIVGKTDEAIADYQRVLRRRQYDSTTRGLLVKLYLRLGRVDDARKLVRKGLRRYPTDQALRALAAQLPPAPTPPPVAPAPVATPPVAPRPAAPAPGAPLATPPP